MARRPDPLDLALAEAVDRRVAAQDTHDAQAWFRARGDELRAGRELERHVRSGRLARVLGERLTTRRVLRRKRRAY